VVKWDKIQVQQTDLIINKVLDEHEVVKVAA
jgi:hypothetical protein